MKWVIMIVVIAALLFLAGCASHQSAEKQDTMHDTMGEQTEPQPLEVPQDTTGTELSNLSDELNDLTW